MVSRLAWLLPVTILAAAAAAIATLMALDWLLGLREPILFGVVSIPVVAVVAWLVSTAIRRLLR